MQSQVEGSEEVDANSAQAAPALGVEGSQGFFGPGSMRALLAIALQCMH